MAEKKDEKVMVEAESEKIWAEIGHLPIDVYAVGNQVVANCLQKINLPGSELFVKLNSTAVLPALETSLSNMNYTRGKRYEIEQAKGYTIIRRVTNRDDEVQKVIAAMEAANKA